ncbi:carotenoid cleavage dioxygenase 1 [Colletotrichum truncatum]|uniref:Carotenoid cleavage dioxygenase 1 n=1 Tax=Colletotrichum truncatum TaxID=5467 RepID=A0ACC3YEA9_COLTU|nr:carotenoid cleavage dioxygenase 1 [Colletotrichum truncatum]KAF6790094.1 carotenoid cleavage dioxygenase 1 [Colletotrichum truncatum]
MTATITTTTRLAAETVLRTAKDEASDLQKLRDNRLKGSYDEWPNEAGFDGLTEERGPIELNIQGEIPAWAAGALYRTGPGSCKIENTPKGTHYVSHWFDGLAHTHKFDIIAPEAESDSKTRVLYSSRRQCDQLVKDIQANGFQNRFSFGQRRDPCVGMFGKIMSVFSKATAPNICVAVNANVPGLTPAVSEPNQGPSGSGHRNGVRSVWLSTDANPLLEIDADTLEPVGTARQNKLHPDLTGPMSCAHAQRDPETGDMFNFNLGFGRLATYRIFRVSAATGKTDILASISEAEAKPAYIHSFFLTKSFVILCIPVTHLGFNGLKVPWERNILDAIEPFDEAKRCRWYFVDRIHDKGVVATFETPAGFFFHSTNSFEEAAEDGSGIDVFCEAAAYQNHSILHNFYYDVILNRNNAAHKFWTEGDRLKNSYASLQRYKFRIPSDNADATSPTEPELVLSIPAPHVGELPTINPAFLTRRHRYVYSLPDRGLSTFLDAIVKTDADTREALIWQSPQAHTPGEPIFVPRPPSAGGDPLTEDDGVILSVVLDGTAQTSYLLCLDAKTMTELGRAECDFAVGMGFHGIHAPSGPI